jgi:hypothetical protein
VRLVPVGKPAFPDQQQDLQNAAHFSVASECDGSVKFPRRAVKADSTLIWLKDRVLVGWGVSEVQAGCIAGADRNILQIRTKGGGEGFR